MTYKTLKVGTKITTLNEEKKEEEAVIINILDTYIGDPFYKIRFSSGVERYTFASWIIRYV